jgi:hypothetical protein
LARERFGVWRACEPDLLYRVAKADSLGRNAEWVPREKWYGAEAQEWFISARGSCKWSNVRRIRCCWATSARVGSRAGPRMGEITRAVYEMQLDGRVRNLDEAIARRRS